MKLLNVYDSPAVDNIQSSDNNPVNTQQLIQFSTEFTAILIIIAIIFAVTIIVLSIIVFEKNKNIKRLEQFAIQNINEEEQQLINDFRKLNPQGKTIVTDTCKTLTDNNTTKNDGV